MKKRVCDRCGCPIGKVSYTIDIYAHGEANYSDALAQNLCQNLQNIYGPKRYCGDCKEEIEKVMNNAQLEKQENVAGSRRRRSKLKTWLKKV